MSDEQRQKRVTGKRGGRPKKSEQDRRNVHRATRFTEDEDIALRSQADAAGMSVSEYIRQTSLAAALASETLTLPLSDDDRKAITLNAIEAGYDFKEYVITTLRKLRRPSDRKINARMVTELNRVGINLDQCLHDHRIPKKAKPSIQPILRDLTKTLEKIAGQL